MAIVANTYLTFDAKGIREELSNLIYNISPEDTPFQSNIGKVSVSNTLFEWQTDSLAAAAANAQLEGDDIATFPATTATTRVGNYTQISRKLVLVSGTLEAVDKAGRRSEETYQLMKKGAELKRDVEFIALSNVAGVAGNSTTARTTATLRVWLKTNTDLGVGGADSTYTSGVPTPAATDGTQRAFTEALLKVVIREAFVSGGKPTMLMLGPFNKQAASAFAGIAEVRYDVKGQAPTTIIGAADVYVSDFGNLAMVPNRFQRERDAWLIDPEYAAIATLRPIQKIDLAKTGDAEKSMLLWEWGLKVDNEAAHGIVADLTTS